MTTVVVLASYLTLAAVACRLGAVLGVRLSDWWAER